MKSLSVSARALAAALPLLSVSAPAVAQPETNPLTTIVVIGHRPDPGPATVTLEPERTARLATLPDLLAGAPGVLAQTNFGGIDHPRLSIRGSGLQRGTQPAGRGIELRLDGLPMTYADTSFDFVEWIEPLAFDRVRVLRGGRGVLVDGASLGGVIDFHLQSGAAEPGGLVRAEVGSFGAERAQLAVGHASRSWDGFVTATWYDQEGDRQFAAQRAARALGQASWALSDRSALTASLLWTDSELELPGPLTQAQIAAGSQAAQPGNVNGDWRRFSTRSRIAVRFEHEFGPVNLDLGVSGMATDTEFRRRDVQVEDSFDVSLTGALTGAVGAAEWRLGYLGQRGDRDVQQYLNGGGTPQSFTGARGLLWADNALDAARDTLSVGGRVALGNALTVEGVVAYSRHTRDASDRFSPRPGRPAVMLDMSYEAATGLALLRYSLSDQLEVFAAASRTQEPPTWDALLINANGVGMGAALVNGANPRRPVLVPLGDQTADTLEAGVRGAVGPLKLDLTVYRSWLAGELVSTTDPVSQSVSSVGNADATRRWGLEGFAALDVATGLSLTGSWTWTDARFADDLRFGNNRLPIVPEHMLGFSLDYENGPYFIGLRADWVPEGGFADYANSRRAEGYTTLGGRTGWQGEGFAVFVEGRNLTDERYVSTVIAAQNNLGGADTATFAPGEGRAITLGIETRFGPG